MIHYYCVVAIALVKYLLRGTQSLKLVSKLLIDRRAAITAVQPDVSSPPPKMQDVVHQVGICTTCWLPLLLEMQIN